MEFQWDPKKAVANLRKHGVDFADAVAVFFDERAITLEDLGREERRYLTLGTDALGHIVVVSYAWRGEETIRLISARKATARERREYGGQP